MARRCSSMAVAQCAGLALDALASARSRRCCAWRCSSAPRMVYASIRFLQEWASPLTLVELPAARLRVGLHAGHAAGAPFESRLAAGAALAPGRAAAFTLAGAGHAQRLAARATPGSSRRPRCRRAIGIKHPRIVQKAQGFMGGSFNTREFFHGRSAAWLRGVKWAFLLLVFPLPLLCLAARRGRRLRRALLALAFVLQYLGLLAERWFFLAQAQPPAEPVLPDDLLNLEAASIHDDATHAFTATAPPSLLALLVASLGVVGRRARLAERGAPGRQPGAAQAAARRLSAGHRQGRPRRRHRGVPRRSAENGPGGLRAERLDHPAREPARRATPRPCPTPGSAPRWKTSTAAPPPARARPRWKRPRCVVEDGQAGAALHARACRCKQICLACHGPPPA